MRLKRVRVQNYRSIHDTGWFDVEDDKTILVGPNEAGKTAILRALQTVKMPPGEDPDVDPLRDYPRSRFSEIDQGKVNPSSAPLATAVFSLDEVDRAILSEHAPHLSEATEMVLTRYHDKGLKYSFGDVTMWGSFGDVEKPLGVLRGALVKVGDKTAPVVQALKERTAAWGPTTTLREQQGQQLDALLEQMLEYLDLGDDRLDKAFDAVRAAARRDGQTSTAYKALSQRVPIFVYFSHYFKVHPRIHLGRLASQEDAGDVDQEYDFGNLCLLRLLGLTAAELAALGRSVPDVIRDHRGTVHPTAEEVKSYQDRLDRRSYRLNAASMALTAAISGVWGESRELDIQPDGLYLRVVVRNEDGARVELDQGSEGFRWLVSFYVVFEAQAKGDYENAILLLDEPGTSLHALKQKQFRETVSQISAKNQTVFTTHSPFMVGSDEMDKVRIVEMKDRSAGTKVHEDFAVHDPRSLFPLQAHFGYELGQTLFGQHRNLVVEGITDYWYLQAVVEAARDAGEPALDAAITILPAGDAGKVVYHATVLHAQDLRVAALFDSDPAGVTAAADEVLAHFLKPKQILLVGSFYQGGVDKPEIEDLLRTTLLTVALDELGIDATAAAGKQPKRAVCDLLGDAGGPAFSKYRLGKAFVRWMREHGWSDLPADEQEAMRRLFVATNRATR